VPVSVVRAFRILPIDDDGETLTIAVADPLATEVVEVLRARAGRRVVEVVATPSQLAVYVARWCEGEERAPPYPPLDLETLLDEVRADRLHVLVDDEEQDA
jgi:hypothetical protein